MCQARLESERKVTGSHLWRFEMRAVILDGEGCGDFGLRIEKKNTKKKLLLQNSLLPLMMMMMMMMMMLVVVAAAVDLASPMARDRSYDEILVTEKLNAAANLACFFSLYSIKKTPILS